MTTTIDVKNLTTSYNGRIIHDNISFSVKQNEIYAFLGGSGSGKSTLMNTLILLKRPDKGVIKILNEEIWKLRGVDLLRMQLNLGVSFQFGALFSSLSVLENITVSLQEYSYIPQHIAKEIAEFWLNKVGLQSFVGDLFPSELSGGMVKRVALARALVLSPKILFLDEPTSGLDPKSARQFDALISELRDLLNMSVVMITHDMESVHNIVDRCIYIQNKKILLEGNVAELMALNLPSLDLGKG